MISIDPNDADCERKIRRLQVLSDITNEVAH